MNNGKMLKASFELNRLDIARLDLRDTIVIGNTKWNINKIIDYNANSNNLTSVELISSYVDDLLEVPFLGVPPNTNSLATFGGVNIQQLNIGTADGRNNNTQGGSVQGNNNQNVDGVVMGNFNQVVGESIVIGNYNEVLTSGALVVGNGYSVTQEGIFASKIEFGGITTGVVLISANYIVASNINTVVATASNLLVVVPNPTTCKGRVIIIKNKGVTGTNIKDELLDNLTNEYYLDNLYEAITIQSDGLQWLIINDKKDSVREVTTTDGTITDLDTFTPSTNGVWMVEWMVSGLEVATGNAIGIKAFATFKVIAGVVTQLSNQTIDRKSDFAGVVTLTLNTDGTVIRARVTGQAGKTINWKGTLTITK
jgi:hypothetical protein